VLGNVLDGDAVRDDPALLSSLGVLLSGPLGESPLIRPQDLLSSGELILSSAEGFDDMGGVGVLATDRHDHLADLNTGSHFHGLSVRPTHTGGETICSGARQHLILTNDVERVASDSNVVTFLAGGLDEVLVACNACGLEGASGELLLLVGDQVDNAGEVVNRVLLVATVVDTDLGVWYTSAVSGLDVRLILLEAKAASRSSSHFIINIKVLNMK
jgi:hypothetical protein